MSADLEVTSYIKRHYKSAKYKLDTYQLFIELGIQLASEDGSIAYITPNTFFKNKFANELRKIIVTQTQIQDLVIFNYPVFVDAAVDTALFTLTKKSVSVESFRVTVAVSEAVFTSENAESSSFNQKSITIDTSYAFEFGSSTNSELLRKIEGTNVLLGKVGRAYFGIQTFDRKKYVSKIKSNGNHPVIDGSNALRYFLKPANEFVVLGKESVKSGGSPSVYAQDRLVVRQIGVFPEAAIVEAGIYTLNTVYNIFLTDTSINLRYLLAIINSKVIAYYWKSRFYDNKATFPKIKKEPLESLPIPNITPAEQQPFIALADELLNGNRALHAADAQFATLLQAELGLAAPLTGKLAPAQEWKLWSLALQKAIGRPLTLAEKGEWLPHHTQQQQQQAQRRQHLATLDKQLDQLVYKLYQLTDAEIALVEGMAGAQAAAPVETDSQ